MTTLTNSITLGASTTLAYGTDDPAIFRAEFGADSKYIVVSSRLAADIVAGNVDYSPAHLKQGLIDGWLILVINPDLFTSLTDPLKAVRAIKSDEEIEEGWFRMFIAPEFGKRYF